MEIHMSAVVAEGLFRHSVHVIISIIRAVRRQVSRIAALDLQRADFGLFRRQRPLGGSPAGQWGPGMLDVLQGEHLKGSRANCPHVLKDEPTNVPD